MKLTDAHCHFLPDVYVKALKKYDRINEDGFPIPDWSYDMQMEYMEKCCISHAILSLSTPHPHFGDDSFSADLCRSINEFAAQMKKNPRTGFPLPHVFPFRI